jgi:hypothetical protein
MAWSRGNGFGNTNYCLTRSNSTARIGLGTPEIAVLTGQNKTKSRIPTWDGDLAQEVPRARMVVSVIANVSYADGSSLARKLAEPFATQGKSQGSK